MINAYIHAFTEAAKNAGITRLNFYLEEKHSRSLSVYSGELETMNLSQLSQLFIEGEYEGFCGSVFVEALDESKIAENIAILIASSAFTKKPFVPYELNGLPKAGEGSCEFYDLAAAVEVMAAAEAAVHNYDSRILPTGNCGLSEGQYRVTLADEKGNMASDVHVSRHFRLSATAKEGEEIQFSYQGDSCPAEGLPDMVSCGKEAAREAISRLGASSWATGEYPVVLERRVVCELLDAFMPTFCAHNVQNNMSVLAGKMGEKIAHESISIVEDPQCAEGLYNRRFDDEGVLTARKEIVSDGKLSCFLYNRETAAKDGTVSGGNGFKNTPKEPVSTGYTNVILTAGQDSLEELLQKMGNGILITNVSGVFAGAHPVSGNFSLISKGHVVENGKIGRCVQQITIAGNFFEMLEKVMAIGCDNRRVHYSSGCIIAPSLYIGGLMISGEEEA